MTTLAPLRVTQGQITDATGHHVRLRGTCIGGWLNLENFINGFPGAASSLRSVMNAMLGSAKTTFFFDRLLHHFLTEPDLAFIHSTGANVVRLPLNYRHFEDDLAPFAYRAEGFAWLDNVVEWCAAHEIYVILDLHAVQGWQNPDWHSDNANRQSLLWQHPHFQDRFIALWETFARHYVGNPTIAGYNLMNEPVSNAPNGLFPGKYQPDYATMNALYRRAVTAIRALDPDHLIFLEGDRFSTRFAGLEPPFAPHLVYSSHNYTAAGFGPGIYPGTFTDRFYDAAEQEHEMLASEGVAFTRQHGVPLWVGEFGVPYNGLADEVPDRLRALDDQIAILDRHQAHWTTWTYKDVGVMGWVHLAPDSAYLQRIAPVLTTKTEIATDFWMQWLPATRISTVVDELADTLAKAISDTIDPRQNRQYFRQTALELYGGHLLQQVYAERFAALSEDEIDRVLQSFRFEQCVIRQDLVTVISKALAREKPIL